MHHTWVVVFVLFLASTYSLAVSGDVDAFDKYFSLEKKMICSMCPSDTYLKGPCKIPNGDSDCPLCPPGTSNRYPYHLNRTCTDSPTIDDKTPPGGSYIHPYEEPRQKQNQQPKEVTSQPSNSQGRIQPMQLLVYLTFTLFFLFFNLNEVFVDLIKANF